MANTLGQSHQFSCPEAIWLCRACIHMNKCSCSSKYDGIIQAIYSQLFLACTKPQAILRCTCKSNSCPESKKTLKSAKNLSIWTIHFRICEKKKNSLKQSLSCKSSLCCYSILENVLRECWRLSGHSFLQKTRNHRAALE